LRHDFKAGRYYPLMDSALLFPGYVTTADLVGLKVVCQLEEPAAANPLDAQVKFHKCTWRKYQYDRRTDRLNLGRVIGCYSLRALLVAGERDVKLAEGWWAFGEDARETAETALGIAAAWTGQTAYSPLRCTPRSRLSPLAA
jgi:hypothetical protein